MKLGIKIGFKNIPPGHLEKMSKNLDFWEYSMIDRIPYDEVDTYGLPVLAIHQFSLFMPHIVIAVGIQTSLMNYISRPI